MNTSKFYERLKIISEQINQIINQNDMNPMQQQMMMQQQIMMQQQMLMKQQMVAQHQMNSSYKNIIFKKAYCHTVLITVKYGTKVEEVLKEYIKRISGYNKKLAFLHNGSEIKWNEQSVVENFFKYNDNHTIQVLEN